MLNNLLAALSIAAPIVLVSALDGASTQGVDLQPPPSWSEEDLHRSPPKTDAEHQEVLELIQLHRAYLAEVRR